MSAIQPLLPDVDFAYDDVPNLHELLDQLRAEGPVVPVKYLNDTVYLINSFKELKQAFSDEEHFACAAAHKLHSVPSLGITMQALVGEEHRINRGLVSRPFFPKLIRAAIEALIEPTANELLDEIEGQKEVEFVTAFTKPFPFRVITRMLGIPVDDEDKLLHWAVKLIDYPWDPEGAVQARHDFADYMKPVLDARRAQPADDIISQLVVAEFEGNTLSDEEIYSFLRMLFPAGSDTTYKLGGSMFYAILSDPGIRARAMLDDKAREDIVQEALRWQAPVALLPRMCSKDTELGGVKIKQGQWMLFGITAANSDPEIFENPRQFDPDRKNKIMTFGHGEHFCLGSHLARRELETAVRVVLERFPNMALSPDKEVSFVGGVLRGTPELWVRPQG